MAEKSVFISSCSRRQLARRRVARAMWRYELPPVLLVVALGVVAFMAGRGGI
ncbi:MAG: hypothetical protein QOD66_586 [Solirubrobacteraceae bacterium]|nr:hypothetical protein [Solirubrobacteraceae bacterium]